MRKKMNNYFKDQYITVWKGKPISRWENLI